VPKEDSSPSTSPEKGDEASQSWAILVRKLEEPLIDRQAAYITQRGEFRGR